jgi:transposase-like protein
MTGDSLIFPLRKKLPKKEERDIPPVSMNITNCRTVNRTDKGKTFCPACHSFRCQRHGCYYRKGFHLPNYAVIEPMKIQRYLCLNPDCPRSTFSILPDNVMRYCRFFWTGLLALKAALDAGVCAKRLAENVWQVGTRVILRAAALLDRLCPWVGGLHQELTCGKPVRELAVMVKVITAKCGRLELSWRWYRHRYPLRFSDKFGRHTI